MISVGEAVVLSSPIAAAAAAGSVIDFWLRDAMMPPADSLRLVVVLPARARQGEQPLALGEGSRRRPGSGR